MPALDVSLVFRALHYLDHPLFLVGLVAALCILWFRYA